MSIRVLAISAPHYETGGPGNRVLTSTDPVSLYNACRHPAAAATRGEAVWGHSNWSGTRSERRRSLFLIHSLDRDLADFESALERVQPHLLLVGAMSLCLPGAVACARRAREILGDRVAIVLGGWHASETIFRSPSADRVIHHAASPVRLMAEGALGEDTFDVVVSGASSALVTRLGEIIGTSNGEAAPARAIRQRLHEAVNVHGEWIASLVEGGIVRELVGDGAPAADAGLPAPSALFGVGAAFDVFDSRPTAHVFSDSGRGCVYDCTFCSERLSAVGSPPSLGTAAARLHHQLETAARVVFEDHPGRSAAAFVEDSVFLGGSTKAIERFLALTQERHHGVTFGCQFTIDQVLSKRHLLPRLAEAGLSYVFVGLETSDPPLIGGLSKNVRPQSGWLDRMETVLDSLATTGIDCGVAVLFGLGEDQRSRLQLLAQLERWRETFRSPRTISFNWAVQHPLRGHDGGRNYRYLDWGLPDADWSEAFASFGEASALYPLAGRRRPQLQEVVELHHAIGALSSTQPIQTIDAQPELGWASSAGL